MDSDSDSKEEESITTTKTSLPLPPALKIKDVPKTKGVKDGVEREGAESWVDGVAGSGVWVADWQVKEKKMGVLDTREDVRRDEDVVLKRKGERDRSRSMEEVFRQRGVEEERLREEKELSKIRRRIKMSKIIEELTEKGRQCNKDVVLGRVMGESRQQGVGREEGGVLGGGVWAVVQRVEEKMRIPDTGEDVRRDEDVALERTEEGDMLRDMEGVGQRGVEDEGTKKSDEEQSKIREGRKTSKLRGKLTKKNKRQLLQGMDKVFSRGNGLRRRHHWKRHQQIVEDLEKRWELSKRSRDLRRHLQSRRCYVAPQIGSALACFLSPLHMEIKDRKEIERVDDEDVILERKGEVWG